MERERVKHRKRKIENKRERVGDGETERVKHRKKEEDREIEREGR